jgi:hypothetical protein
VFVLSQDVLNQSKDQIKNLKIAIPQFGNTQDLLSKIYFKDLSKDPKAKEFQSQYLTFLAKLSDCNLP